MTISKEVVRKMREHLSDGAFVRACEDEVASMAESIADKAMEYGLGKRDADSIWDEVIQMLNKGWGSVSPMYYLIELFEENGEEFDMKYESEMIELGNQVAQAQYHSYGDMVSEIGARGIDRVGHRFKNYVSATEEAFFMRLIMKEVAEKKACG